MKGHVHYVNNSTPAPEDSQVGLKRGSLGTPLPHPIWGKQVEGSHAQQDSGEYFPELDLKGNTIVVSLVSFQDAAGHLGAIYPDITAELEDAQELLSVSMEPPSTKTEVMISMGFPSSSLEEAPNPTQPPKFPDQVTSPTVLPP